MNITQLLFSQTSGVFFVWKTSDKNLLATFLRNRHGVSVESQIDKAIADGSGRTWELIGMGYWGIQPITIRDSRKFSPTPHSPTVTVTLNHLSAALLRPRKLPLREQHSTERGVHEMREKCIPYIRRQIRKILWEVPAD